ncbi:flagellar filament capping protein FliD [Massilia sp. Dwa41.01b]|uniref:flagellar filament capping protein FliD n=1 Tax=unclassified Massilia TaxID=2609279 RepID=UPI0015FF1A5C|nr:MULTISPECIES: flagellar filament capping protein FliD [unclassified Massilia]QNA90061.1 flagellar filament capping protein FliD [Massilia sp. Dwa41.01b]QNB00950.1 flagellar filament capping protein FliD [Massilia sp. Se16.2.3]
MATISGAGMLSGLPVDSLVSSLMGVERQPLANMQSKQASFSSKLSAFGTLKSAVSAFQTAVKNVSGDALAALTATSSKSETVGVSVAKGSGASAGSYAIEVSKLAQSDKLVSSGVAANTTFTAAGSAMEISIGGKTTKLDLADGNLASLSSAINKANAGVTATILNDGTSDRLVITGNNTGKDNGVTIKASGSLAAFDTTAGSMTLSQKAQNAEMTIDSVSVSKASNTVTDAIKGVTLNLAQTNVGSPVKISLAKDTTNVTKDINAFVDAYNTLATAVNKQTAYNATTKTGAVLNGDAGARSILTNIRAELGKGASGAGGLATLSDIGIAFQRDGTLKMEKPDKLKAALETNFTGVSTLFSGTDGVATRLSKVTEDMLGSKGLFKNRTDGLNASIESINKSADRMELQLAQTEKRYRAQFTSLDTMMTNMQNMNSYLTQQLAALAANSGY